MPKSCSAHCGRPWGTIQGFYCSFGTRLKSSKWRLLGRLTWCPPASWTDMQRTRGRVSFGRQLQQSMNDFRMPRINSATVSNSKKQTYSRDIAKGDSSRLLTKRIEIDKKSWKNASLRIGINYAVTTNRKNSKYLWKVYIRVEHGEVGC